MTWNISGKTVLVTGATNGIGFEACLELAKRGARVRMVGRDPKRTEHAAAEVRAKTGADVAHYLCDFESQARIRALARKVLDENPRIDVLVNNAGTVNEKRRLTEDGIEATFAVNHLGYLLLTNLLLDRIVASAPARIVTVASTGHYRGTMDFDDLGFERGYWIMKAYSRSKLGNVLFSNELARRLEGKGVTSNSLHPGGVRTNIWSGAPGWSKPIISLALKPFMISAAEGGATIVQLAASPELEGVTGTYFEHQAPRKPSRLARDPALAAKLWDVSARMVGLEGTGDALRISRPALSRRTLPRSENGSLRTLREAS